MLNDDESPKKPSFVDHITNNRFKEAISLFSECCEHAPQQRDDKLQALIEPLLGTPMQLTGFDDGHVIFSFWKALLEDVRTDDYSYPLMFINFFLKREADLEEDKDSLSSKLIKIYLKHASAFKQESAINQFCRESFVSKSVLKQKFHIAYQTMEESEQKNLVKNLLNDTCNKKLLGSQFFYDLKVANPKIFKEVRDSFDENVQRSIDELLSIASEDSISLIKEKEFSKAANILVHHPRGALGFLDSLSLARKGSDSLSSDEIFKLFKQVLKVDSEDRLLSAFNLMRACFDSERFADKKKKKLLTGFLGILVNESHVDLIQGLQKYVPNLFAQVLEKDNETKSTIESLLDQSIEQQEKNLITEWTLHEQDRISGFTDLLNENNTEHFSGYSGARLIEDMRREIARENISYKNKNFPKALISAYLRKAIELGTIKEAADFLSLQPSWGIYILDVFKEQSAENQEKLMAPFLENCGNRFNATMVCGLKEINQSLFESALKGATDQDFQKKIQGLLNVPPEARSNVSDIMNQFSLPFRRMTAYAASLVCAEMSNRKNYVFNPTVLSSSSELLQYLAILKSTQPPIRRRFLVGIDHWIAGEIDIPEHGKPKLVLIDSLGSSEPKTTKIIRKCLSVFESLDIYISDEKRQHSNLGCTVFSLKDVQELFSVGSYLDQKYKGDFLNYVSDNIISTESLAKNTTLASYRLPLRFLRSEQSQDLLNGTIPKRTEAEKSLPVNKKGETVVVSANKHFKKVADKYRNERAAYKLNKMAEKAFAYLSENNFDLIQIESKMNHFSFEGLKRQIANESHVDSTGLKQKNETVRSNTDLLCQFDQRKISVDKSRETAINRTESTENLKEKNMKNVRNLLQEKFKFQIFYLSQTIEHILEQYKQGDIKDVDTLKASVKTFLGLESDRTDRFLIDNQANRIYWEEILKCLLLLASADSSHQPTKLRL